LVDQALYSVSVYGMELLEVVYESCGDNTLMPAAEERLW
jgi:hypothetical protein